MEKIQPEKIVINGVTYVREQTEPEFEIFAGRELELNGDGFTLVGRVIEPEPNSFSMPEIEYQPHGFGSSRWDNEKFIKGIAEGSEKHMNELNDLPGDDKRAAVILAKEMKKRGWL